MKNSIIKAPLFAIGALLLAAGIAVGYTAGQKTPQGEKNAVEEPIDAGTPVTAPESFRVMSVNIFECGHILEQDENLTVTAAEAEQTMNRLGGYNYEVKDGRIVMYREYDYCCPEHFFTQKTGEAVAVYKTDDMTLRKHQVCLLDIQKDSPVFEDIGYGMIFGSLEDINLYLEGADE